MTQEEFNAKRDEITKSIMLSSDPHEIYLLKDELRKLVAYAPRDIDVTTLSTQDEEYIMFKVEL
jgi:hypothetical protein